MPFNKLLDQQITRHLSPEVIENTPGLKEFISEVRNTYVDYDQDKEFAQHAFDISDQEHTLLNKRLSKELEQNKENVRAIIQIIQLLEGKDASSAFDADELNLEAVISSLKQISLKFEKYKQDLIEAKEIAEEANQTKSEFLSIMSHEIRSPLNVIVGMAHIMDSENLDPAQRENIRILNIASQNLLLLINDVLDYNKIESGKIELSLHDFSLGSLLQDIRLAQNTKATENGSRVKLFLDSLLPQMIIGDSLRVGQIITNLVSNAVKFTHNGLIEIHANLLNRTPNSVTLRLGVKDTGIGIAKENHDKIFDKFTQAKLDTTKKFGGTGLGLSITAQLLQLMDSKIKLESEEGKGSHFYFDIQFPIALTDNNVEKKRSEIKNFDGLKVLVVDDSEFNLLIASKIISKWNANVTTVNSGSSCLETIESEDFDIVLMDLQMPDISGFETTIRIREMGINTPVIALTASTNNDTKKEVEKAGMNGFMGKPFNPDELFYKIKQVTQEVLNAQ